MEFTTGQELLWTTSILRYVERSKAIRLRSKRLCFSQRAVTQGRSAVLLISTGWAQGSNARTTLSAFAYHSLAVIFDMGAPATESN